MISLSSVSGRLNAFLMDCEGGTLFFILTPSQGFGSDKWRPCPSEEPDTDGNSSFLETRLKTDINQRQTHNYND